jgi:hypothetical protein
MNPTFIGAAKRIDDIDLPRLGATIGVGEDELHAFMDVEAAGSGFDARGRPKMLFEPHVFYRNLSGAKRDAAVAQGLAYSRWGQKPYPGDSYPRLIAAMAIDETAALKAASWGSGQILGENHRMVGYDTPQEMVAAFMEDEDKHLEAIVAFLVAAGIDDDLRAHRWPVVARVYNGPGYAKHNYDGRMAAAFNKWARIPDTPWNGAVEIKLPDDDMPTIRRGADGESVIRLQRMLNDRGYGLKVDGDFGPATEGAVKTFQGRSGLIPDGVVGRKTWAALTT